MIKTSVLLIVAFISHANSAFCNTESSNATNIIGRIRRNDESHQNGALVTEQKNCGTLSFSDMQYLGQTPENISVPEGSSFELKCKYSGSPQPIVHWLKNGAPIFYTEELSDYETDPTAPSKNGNGYAITVAKLDVQCADTSHQGVYSCAANNGLIEGVSKIAVHLHVHKNEFNPKLLACRSKPTADQIVFGKSCQARVKIFQWTDTVMTAKGSRVRLMCRAKGHPKPHIQWSRNEQTLTDEQNDEYTMLDNGDLLIKGAKGNDVMSKFTCTAQNYCSTESVSPVILLTQPEDSDEK